MKNSSNQNFSSTNTLDNTLGKPKGKNSAQPVKNSAPSPKNSPACASKGKPAFTAADFLPTTRAHMEARGWAELDVLLISGDAYIDHPSFGVALLGRWLEKHGFRVGIIAQPRWDTVDDISRLGRPRLLAGVTAGAVDSMLAHYTAFRKKRHDDAYTPGGQCGARPNRAVSVYTNLVRRAFPGLPVVAGGIEASLRRISHYDFWTDSLRKSLLPDAKLDGIIYGMGEQALLELTQRLDAQSQLPEARRKPLAEVLNGIPGTARMGKAADYFFLKDQPDPAYTLLPAHEDMVAQPELLLRATLLLEQHVHQGATVAVQCVGDRAVILEAPAAPLSTAAMDALYHLPYTRQPHPDYVQPIPAAEMMLPSITSHRGCGGGCSFCSLALHQGRRIASRSEASLMAEAQALPQQPGFHGAISDVGGPSANMWQATCSLASGQCKRVSCLFPALCTHFQVDQFRHIELLRAMQHLPGIKHVRVASGVRFDLALHDEKALAAYTGEFTGGQLKVAPEHACPEVLTLMRKPGMEDFERFLAAFYQQSQNHGKEQYVIPYLMSGFPGCTDAHMRELATWLAARNWTPQQVQCFVPTPGTVATAMFYAEVDSQGKTLSVAKTDAERLRQHALLLGSGPRNRSRSTPAKGNSHAPQNHSTAPKRPASVRNTPRPRG